MKDSKNKKTIEVNNSSSIQYKGDVSISFIKKGKVVRKIKNHNEGKNSLFEFLLDCLAGNYYKSNRPTWIIPYYKEQNEMKYSIYKPVPISSVKVTKDNSGPVLSYTCLIPSSLFGNSPQKMDGLLFYSYANLEGVGQDSNFNHNYSMSMEFGGDEQVESTQGQDILIIWQIRIISANQE